jgi:hypothetical protein
MPKGYKNNSLLIGILLILFLIAIATLCQQYNGAVKEDFRRWGWRRRWRYPWWGRYRPWGRRWRYPWWISYWPWGYYNSGYYYY